ncbi:MAG: hypothetical protein CMF59_17440 [Leptospiraceae bacterium]|nr:hypothetical protein [Leptospiraceae bacterium]
MQPRFLVVAGGTGGHLSPGTALASHLQDSGLSVEFLSLKKNSGYPDLKSANYPVHFYSAPSLNARRILLFPFQLIGAIIHAFPVVRKSDAVVLMGGFPCLPAGLAGLMLRKSIYLCEQNAVMGRANRFFARFARNVFLNLPLTGRNHTGDWPVVGNPLRKSFLQKTARSTKKSVAAKKKSSRSAASHVSGFSSGRGSRILVAGGSQGARQLNEMVLDLARSHPDEFQKYRWVLQAGLKNEDYMRSELSGLKNIKVIGFDPDIHRFYREADLMVCRAGAGVLTEAFLFGLPMILIPYPYATDSHQKENAMYAHLAGAGVLIDSTESRGDLLRDALQGLNAKKLKGMARLSHSLARPDAATRIQNYLLQDLKTKT